MPHDNEQHGIEQIATSHVNIFDQTLQRLETERKERIFDFRCPSDRLTPASRQQDQVGPPTVARCLNLTLSADRHFAVGLGVYPTGSNI